MKYTILFVGTVLLHLSKADLPTGCDNAAQDCPDNSECVSDNCACDDGFKLNQNKDGCEAKVIGDDCDGTNGCTGLANSGCANTKCECNQGYVVKDGTCTKIKVSEVECTKGGTDQCKHITDAECDDAETAAKCKCSAGFAEDKTDGYTCVQTIEGTTCTEDDGCVENSHCDSTNCKCDAGYVMNVDVCTPQNAAPMVQFGWMTILLGVLTITQSFF